MALNTSVFRALLYLMIDTQNSVFLHKLLVISIFCTKVLLALFKCVLEIKIVAGRLIVSFLYCVFVSVQNDFDVCLGDVADTVYSWKIN